MLGHNGFKMNMREEGGGRERERGKEGGRKVE